MEGILDRQVFPEAADDCSGLLAVKMYVSMPYTNMHHVSDTVKSFIREEYDTLMCGRLFSEHQIKLDDEECKNIMRIIRDSNIRSLFLDGACMKQHNISGILRVLRYSKSVRAFTLRYDEMDEITRFEALQMLAHNRSITKVTLDVPERSKWYELYRKMKKAGIDERGRIFSRHMVGHTQA
jgi:hypothetical protein